MEQQEIIFRQWLDTFAGLMYKVSRTFAGDQEDRNDLLQEIYYQVWLSIPAFRGQSQASTWIYKVALNTALSWQRRERRQSRWEQLMPDSAGPSHGAAQEPFTACEDMERQELLREAYRAVCALPKVDCALALLYLNGLKYAEMAEILGMSESNVGVRLNRIRQHLAKMMEGQSHES